MPPTANATSIEPDSDSDSPCLMCRCVAKNANGPYSAAPSMKTVTRTRRAHGRTSTERHCANRLGVGPDAGTLRWRGSRTTRNSSTAITTNHSASTTNGARQLSRSDAMPPAAWPSAMPLIWPTRNLASTG